MVLGAGLGAFIDGIVLHQILGWHHLVCTTETCRPNSIAALQLQNTQDGWFHAAAFVLTVAGIVLTWRAQRDSAGRASGRVACGGSLAGWGLFNLVEGLIDHQILALHHVKPDSPHWMVYDALFLLLGLGLIVVGYVISSRSTERA